MLVASEICHTCPTSQRAHTSTWTQRRWSQRCHRLSPWSLVKNVTNTVRSSLSQCKMPNIPGWHRSSQTTNHQVDTICFFKDFLTIFSRSIISQFMCGWGFLFVKFRKSIFHCNFVLCSYLLARPWLWFLLFCVFSWAQSRRLVWLSEGNYNTFWKLYSFLLHKEYCENAKSLFNL